MRKLFFSLFVISGLLATDSAHTDSFVAWEDEQWGQVGRGICEDEMVMAIHPDGSAARLTVKRPEYVPDEVIFKVVTPEDRHLRQPAEIQHLLQEVAQRHGLDETRSVFPGKTRELLKYIYRAHLQASVSPVEACKYLEADSAIEWAEPHYYRYTQETTPNDPLYSSQSYLDTIEAPWAWDVNTGSRDVVVAIIDSGVDWNHSDLVANIWINTGEIGRDGIDNDDNGFIDDLWGWDFVSVSASETYPGEDPGPPDDDPMDFLGHGTHVAGIAGADSNNGIGVAGVCWNVKLMLLRAGYKNSSGKGTLQVADIAEALVYAADNGAHIANMSFGGYYVSHIERVAIDYCDDAGILMIAAAGNDKTDKMLYPAGFENVVAVAATDMEGVRWSGSNYGVWIDVAAPGANIYSTLIGGGYGAKYGTSMASPIVAGVAGLIKSIHPSWSAHRIALQLRSTAKNINDDNTNLVNLLGAGLVNAAQAVTATAPPVKLGVVSLWTEEIAGDSDGEIDAGETIGLWPCVKNFATSQAGVSLYLQVTDSNIEVLDDTSFVGQLGEKHTGMRWNDNMTILIDSNTPRDHIASLSLEISTPESGLVSSDVMKLRLNPLLSSPKHLALHTSSLEFIEPKLLLKPGGGIVVIYRSNLGLETYENHIYARSADSSGNWGPALQIADANSMGYTQSDKHHGAVSGTGRVHVSFRGIVGSWDGEIFYTSQDPNDRTWSTPVQVTTNAEIFDIGIDEENTIGVDLEDHPHIVWADYRNSEAELYYIYHDGNYWSTEAMIVKPPGNPSDIQQVHLAFDSTGTGYLLWGQRDDDSIYMMKLTGSTWSSPELVTTTSGYASFSLALDSQDQLHLVYSAPDTDDVSYRHYDGTRWGIPEVIMNTYISGLSERPVIATDHNDWLYVVRRANPYWQTPEIYETVHDGTLWSYLAPITFSRMGIPIVDFDYAINDVGTRLLAASLDMDPTGGFSSDPTMDVVLLTSDHNPARLPSRPTVTDGGLTTNNPTPLEVSWSSSHSSGIDEYIYGVGTIPGEADLGYWTSAGTATSAAIDVTDTPLVAGQTYYISVRARNAIGYWSPCGSSDGITYQPGDFDGDGRVDMVDFAWFAPNWMDTGCGVCGGADLTGDGNVKLDDLREFAGNWLAGIE